MRSPARTSLVIALCAAALAPAVALFTPAAAQDGMMAGSLQRDPAYFEQHVLPILLQHCAGCHDATDPMNETKHRLVVPAEGAQLTSEDVQRNYENVTALLHPTRPARSRLLQKVVPLAWGGLDHDGGKADGDYLPRSLIDAKRPLITWVFGGSAKQKPPIGITGPVKRTVEVGEEVRLDATLSFDPEEDEVRVRWDVLEAPLGSRAKLSATNTKVATFVPDRPGPYLIEMAPDDGKLHGWPRLVRFGAKQASRKPTGDAPAPVARMSTHERRLTRALYLDLWGRTPVEEELALMAALPYEQRVDRMLEDQATWKHWLDEENFYFLLIDRFRPVSDRVVALPEQMMNGAISYSDAHRTIALSTEFNARNPGNDTYVTVVLEQFLGIEVQKETRLLEAAKKMYDGKLSRIFKTKGTNQSDVVAISLTQPSYSELFLRRMEERYLGHRLPDAEHEKWLTFLAENPTEFRKVLREWLFGNHYTSAERTAKRKTDHQFIRSLYVDLLGRPPGREEFRNMRNALQSLADPEPLRGVLAKVILDSGAVIPPAVYDQAEAAGTTTDGAREARAATTELFHRLLGRDPSAAEHEAFSTVIREEGATWRTGAYAILTSAHYQYY